MTDQNHDAIYRDFHQAVNMVPATLDHWLKSDESRSVSISHDGDSESVGHHSSARIVGILRTRKAELSDADYTHMAQDPPDKKDVPDSRWRYSLMNWGHDPLKN